MLDGGARVFADNAQIGFDLTPYRRAWWKDPQSRGYVREEYSKFIYYFFRYQYSWGTFREWLISLDSE
jgi:hypothetical protein